VRNDDIVLSGTARLLRITEEDDTVIEAHYRRGKLHRDHGPAVVQERPDGSVREQYWQDGKLHRDEGPAWVDRDADGSGYEAYYRHGQLHRTDGPAIAISKPGLRIDERYFQHGEQTPGPRAEPTPGATQRAEPDHGSD
jgi:hypothetical protein